LLEAEVQGLRDRNRGLSVPTPVSLPPTKTSEAKYLSLLAQTTALAEKVVSDRSKHAQRVTELQTSLEERRAQTAAVVSAFRELKRATCENSVYAGGKRRIPMSVVHELEDFEVEKEAELSEVRGSWIALTRKLRNLERTLRQRDQLANNLHVVDFEQLKLENQSLSERIELKLEEKIKGERSLHSLFQSHAHAGMRLGALRSITAESSAQREKLMASVLELRDRVIKVKKERDRLALDNADAKRRAKLKNDHALMDDYAANLKLVETLKHDLETLELQLNKNITLCLSFVLLHHTFTSSNLC
jgi:hypothetical protein